MNVSCMFQCFCFHLFTTQKIYIKVGGGGGDLLVGILVQIGLQMSLICIFFFISHNDLLNKFDQNRESEKGGKRARYFPSFCGCVDGYNRHTARVQWALHVCLWVYTCMYYINVCVCACMCLYL